MEWAYLLCPVAFVCGFAVILLELADPWNNT
jgi:hypothetical protein